MRNSASHRRQTAWVLIIDANLTTLVENVLDPLREWYGKPIAVNSGYRCPELNQVVKGTSTSQHLTGQAADIEKTLPWVLVVLLVIACVAAWFRPHESLLSSGGVAIKHFVGFDKCHDFSFISFIGTKIIKIG